MSWVIVSRTSGEAVAEVFDSRTVEKLDADKYKAVPAMEYLAALNASVRAGSGRPGQGSRSVSEMTVAVGIGKR